MKIISECIKCIRNHEEQDCEDGGASYYLSYEDGKIKFTRVTTYDTGDYDGFGVICTKSYGRVLFEEESDMTTYANLAISLLGHIEEYKYEYGSNVECIHFVPIH